MHYNPLHHLTLLFLYHTSLKLLFLYHSSILARYVHTLSNVPWELRRAVLSDFILPLLMVSIYRLRPLERLSGGLTVLLVGMVLAILYIGRIIPSYYHNQLYISSAYGLINITYWIINTSLLLFRHHLIKEVYMSKITYLLTASFAAATGQYLVAIIAFTLLLKEF